MARGFSYEVAQEAGLENSNGSSEEETAQMEPISDYPPSPDILTDKLRYATGLILPLPRREYTADEVDQIKRFVAKGGRVLLLGDPTRTISVEALNGIAGAFGLIYANDYLYSLDHNDNNYRNVV